MQHHLQRRLTATIVLRVDNPDSDHGDNPDSDTGDTEEVDYDLLYTTTTKITSTKVHNPLRCMLIAVEWAWLLIKVCPVGGVCNLTSNILNGTYQLLLQARVYKKREKRVSNA